MGSPQCSSGSSGELRRTVEKLEARLRMYRERSQEFATKVEEFIRSLKSAIEDVERGESSHRLSEDRLRVAESLRGVLESLSDVDHERGHLIEGCGVALSELEKRLAEAQQR